MFVFVAMLFQQMTWGSVAVAAPVPVPVPVAAPRPRPAASVRDVSGLWIGSTSSSQSFKLLVLSQVDEVLEGQVELQRSNGSFASMGFTGRVEGDEMVLNVTDEPLKIVLVLTADGRKTTGKIEESGRPDITVSAIR